MKKYFISSVLLLACIAVLLTGCGQKSPKASTDPVELHMFSSSGQNQEWFDRTYGEYLYEKFPHITFTVHFPSEMTIQDYVATAGPLDIIFGAYTTYHWQIRDTNLQSDISDLIKSHRVDLNKYDPTVIELQRKLAGGGIYGLPAFIGTSGLYYNKDIFDKFAVDYPKEGITWDELYDLAVRLTRKDGDTQYYGFANDNTNYLHVNQLSLDLVDPVTFKPNFENDQWKRIVSTLSRFMTIPGVNPAEATVAAFNTKGTVAMATNYTGCCGFTPGEAVTNWDVIKIPVFPDARNVGVQSFPNFWFMSSISKHRDVSFEVIKFISSEEFQISLNSRGLATALKDTKLHEKYGNEMPKYDGRNVTALFPNPRANK